MSTTEFRKLRNAIIVAFIPIIVLVGWNTIGSYFTIKELEKNKVDRLEHQRSLYEIQALVERKTVALESLATGTARDIEGIQEEIDNINKIILKHTEDIYRLRSTN